MPADLVAHATPTWVVFTVALAAGVAALEFGSHLGRKRRIRLAGEPMDEIGSLVGAMLALLGFLLAIVFGTQLSRFDDYRSLELDEAACIHASWLRADMLPSPERERVKRFLREYVDVRIEDMKARRFDVVLQRSAGLQDEIWTAAIAGTERGSDAFPKELLLESLTELVELHERRVAVGIYQQMPVALWGTLILLAVMAFAVTGYQGGVTGASRSLVRILTVAGFAILLLLIADLSRPEMGLLKVRQLPMIDVRSRMLE